MHGSHRMSCVAVSLRSFEERDRPSVLELSRLALSRRELQVGNPVWTTRDELDGELRDWAPPPAETLFVAEEAGSLVAFGGVELPRGFDHAELFGPIERPHVRGQGIDARLLAASVERARAGGASSVIGAVGTSNSSARMLLEQHGFRRSGPPQAAFRLTPRDHRPVRDGLPLEVRTATRDDVQSAVALYRECFPDGRFSEAVWHVNVEERSVYVAEVEREIVGVLHIDPADRWIYHVGVAERARRRGVAATLLSRSLADYWGRRPGETLGLDVDTDNVAAIRLYRRQGFAPWLVLQTLELEL